ncbi:hypothetical protein [Paraburkholderia fungorum]|uniref:hypothetical protein n=1 Tax=Paraburkholderia fungorum TaxID=134537 RepID=UPI00387802B3
MKPELSKFYEKYSRIHNLTAHGRRVFRRQLARECKEVQGMVYAACQRHAGKKLTLEVAEQIKSDLLDALGPPLLDPIEMIQTVTKSADGRVNVLLTPEFAARINQSRGDYAGTPEPTIA